MAALAPHSRASLAEALATVTPALTGPASRRPHARATRRPVPARLQPDPARTTTDPAVTTQALGLGAAGLTARHPAHRPEGHRAAPDALTLGWMTPRRGEHHHLQAGGIPRRCRLRGRARTASGQPGQPGAVDTTHGHHCGEPAGRRQPRPGAGDPGRGGPLRPELTAFFGCLYYDALRPEEAVALRQGNVVLPPHGRGKLTLTGACPRTGSAWTSIGTPHEPRGLKHRPDGAVRVVPIPPVLADLLRQHRACTGPRRTGGCSAAPAAACSANRSTAASGTPPAPRARPGTGRHAARPPPLRPAACRLVLVAERHRRARRGRRPRREQRPRAARRLHALHRRPRRSSAGRSKTPSTRTPAPSTCHDA